MEIILRNENLIKVKPLLNAVFKCSYGVSGTANEFSAELPFETDSDTKMYSYINFGNTEYGGKVLEKVIDTKRSTVSLYGTTFRGAMQNVIAVREADLTLSGTDVDIVSALFSKTPIEYVIDPSYNVTTRTIIAPLGSTLLQSVETALRQFGEGFVLYISGDKVHLQIVPIITLDSRVDAYSAYMVLDDNRLLPNAFHAYGSVKGSAVAASLYANNNGDIVTSRVVGGDAAVEMFKAYSNDFKNNDELLANMLNDFLTARNKGTKTDVDVDLTSGNIGDKVDVSAMELNTLVKQTITEKHITIKENNIEFSSSTGG